MKLIPVKHTEGLTVKCECYANCVKLIHLLNIYSLLLGLKHFFVQHKDVKMVLILKKFVALQGKTWTVHKSEIITVKELGRPLSRHTKTIEGQGLHHRPARVTVKGLLV